MIQQASKKELKVLAKQARDKGFHEYLNLATFSVEQLQDYLASYEMWKLQAPEREAQEKAIKEEREQNEQQAALELAQKREVAIASIEQQLLSPLPLSEIGINLQEYISNLEEYEGKLWTKNGECRIYITDISYTNPKEVGYIKITPEGEVRTNFIRSIKDSLEESLKKLKTSVKVSQNDLIPSQREQIDNSEWHFGAADEESF